jgi:hypothetical protein
MDQSERGEFRFTEVKQINIVPAFLMHVKSGDYFQHTFVLHKIFILSIDCQCRYMYILGR